MDNFFKDYNAPTDQKVVGTLLKLYADKNAAKYYPAFFAEIQKKYKGNFDKYAEKLFQKTIFASPEKLNAFLDNPSLKVLKKDMAFIAGEDIFNKYRELGQMGGENMEKRARGERLFVAGLMEMESGKTFLS